MPLVLLPGLLCDSTVWRQQAIGLSDIAVTVVPDLSGLDSVHDMARAALTLLPARFSLAGHSMGGYVALEIMRQAPERVTRLALISTQPRRDTAEQAERRRGLIWKAERQEFDAVLDDLIPLFFHQDRLSDRALVDEMVEMAERVGPQAFLRQQKAIVSRPDSVETLTAITCPVLVACGRQDAIAPLENSEHMAAQIKGAELNVFESCGHMAPMECASLTNVVMRRWLSEAEA
ncbi:MAG: alpha/beta hydrolase [Dehalococcoidia bacterium]